MTDQLTLEKLDSLLWLIFFFGFIVGLLVGRYGTFRSIH
jgi:hypothetical protein